MATHYLRMCQERTHLAASHLSSLQHKYTGFLSLDALKFLCLGCPASLLHLSNQIGSNVRYFTALSWQGHRGGEGLSHGMGEKHPRD